MAKSKLKVVGLSHTEQRKAERQWRREVEQQIAEVNEKIGRSALEQLAWIVGLSQQQVGDGAAYDNWRWLWFFSFEYRKHLFGGVSTPASVSKTVPEVKKALDSVRVLICGLADGKTVRFLPELGELGIDFRIDEDKQLSREFRGPLETQVFFRTLDLLDEVGCDRLRRCPYYPPEGKAVCGRVFVKRKGQRYCNREHAQAAAYDAWVTRGMPRGRKGAKTR